MTLTHSVQVRILVGQPFRESRAEVFSARDSQRLSERERRAAIFPARAKKNLCVPAETGKNFADAFFA